MDTTRWNHLCFSRWPVFKSPKIGHSEQLLLHSVLTCRTSWNLGFIHTCGRVTVPGIIRILEGLLTHPTQSFSLVWRDPGGAERRWQYSLAGPVIGERCTECIQEELAGQDIFSLASIVVRYGRSFFVVHVRGVIYQAF